MEQNQHAISWIALIVSLFFAGSMLMGTCNRTQLLKREIKEITASYDSINQRIDSISIQATLEEKKILQTIDSTYSNLDSLHILKSKRTSTVNRTRRAKANRPAGVSGFNLK